jgi:integrase
MRIGAIPGLRLRNLEKVDNLYKITVYENDKEEHFTYCTPECTVAIDNYLAMRKRYGEKFSATSFLIREQFDIRDPFAISKCQKTVSNTLVNKIIDLAERSGIRKKVVLPKEENKKHLGGSYRKEVAICHGFRKFFTTELIRKKVNPEIREMLLGHKIGLASAYYRPAEDDFLEEYQKVIDELTIDPANRMQRTIETLKIEKSRIDMLEAKIQKLEKKHGKIK